MSAYDVREVLKHAMVIEENGYKLYTFLAQKSQEPEVKQLFNFLAEEEGKHKQTFGGILGALQDLTPVETAPTEYFDYLRAYTTTSIFHELSEEEMHKLSDLASALKYSMDRESDSILYYHEIKAFLPESEHDLLDRIIQEERRHYVKLFQLAEKL